MTKPETNKTYQDLLLILKKIGAAVPTIMASYNTTKMCGDMTHIIGNYLKENDFVVSRAGAGKYGGHFDFSVLTNDKGWVSVDPTFIQFYCKANKPEDAVNLYARDNNIDNQTLNNMSDEEYEKLENIAMKQYFQEILDYSTNAFKNGLDAFEITIIGDSKEHGKNIWGDGGIPSSNKPYGYDTWTDKINQYLKYSEKIRKGESISRRFSNNPWMKHISKNLSESKLRKVIRLIIENSISEDEESLLDEYIDGHEELTWKQAETLLLKANVNIETTTTNTGVTLKLFEYFGKKYVVEDFENETTPQEVQDFLESVSFNGNVDYYIKPEDINEDFWQYPQPLFHGTDSDNIEEIMENGLAPMSNTRGISNRGTGAAVFTTTNPEYAEYHYGDTLIKIDTHSMKQNGYTPYVSIEEPIAEYESMQSLAALVGGENIEELEEGLDYNTIVVFGAIPPQFLSIVE